MLRFDVELTGKDQLLRGMEQVGEIVEVKELHSGKDTEFDSWILDEDKLCDELEDTMAAGGNVVDFHSCDFFPERWFDLVLVLRADNTVLFDRLVSTTLAIFYHS